MQLNEEKIYGGYQPEPHDNRDYLTKDFFGAGEPFDWEKGFDIEDELGIKLVVNDQGTSYSCVGQAKSKDREIKEFLDSGEYLLQSARSIYAFRSNFPFRGMNLRDACDIEKDRGISNRSDVPDYQTEAEMNVKPDEGKPTTKSLAYMAFEFYNNIDELAKHIRDYGCAMIAYDGRNNGTNYLPHPVFPDHWDRVQWSHCVLAAKAKLVNGEKRIYFLNSWGEKCGENGWQYITEEDIKNKSNGYNPFYRGWVTVDLITNEAKSMAEQFAKENEGALVQMTGDYIDENGVKHKASGEFGVIVKGILRTGNQLKILLTWAVIKFGKGIPKLLWDKLAKKDIEDNSQ